MHPSTLVGRHVELDELKRTIDAATTGRGSIVLVSGEPGIGKTRLVEAAAEYATSRSVDVRWASCWEGPSVPFWPWAQLVGTGLDALPGAAGGAVGTEADASAVRFALFDAVTSHLRSLASASPLLLVIDDLHWADVGSIRLLEFFSGALRAAQIAVVGTVRDVEAPLDPHVGEALNRLALKATTFTLSGLLPDEVTMLLESATGKSPPSDLAAAVHERTGGNPLFVRELGRLLIAQRRFSEPPDVLPVPEGVQGVIRRRVARLSQSCNDLLQLAAVIGTDFRMDVLKQAAEISTQALLDALDEAEGARIVTAESSAAATYAFSHALIRDVLYDAIPTSLRSAMHERVGRAIESIAGDDLDPHLAALAHHYLLARAVAGTERAIDYALRAGRRALDQLAYEDAVRCFGRALEALESSASSDERADLLLELGEACLRAGDLPRARDVFTKAADLARRRARAQDLARAALGFGAGLSGFEVRLADQVQLDLLEEALAALPDEDSSLRAWVLARLSVAQSLKEPVAERRSAATEAVEIARRIGDKRALAYALSALCDATAGPADSEDRLRLAGEIVHLARAGNDRAMELLGRRLRVVAHLELGDSAAADAEIGAFALVAEVLRQPLYGWYVSLWRGMQALLAARSEEALRYAAEAEEVGARAHSTNAPMLACVLRWMVATQRGRFTDAWGEAVEMTRLMGVVGDPYMELFDACCRALDGRTNEARPMMHRVHGFIRTFEKDSEWLPTMAQWAELVSTLGDEHLAAEAYEMIVPYRSCVVVEGIGAAVRGSAEYHLGLLANCLGRHKDARAHLEAALETNSRLGAPILVALTQRDLAWVLIASGDEARGRELAASALNTFEAHGIDTWAETVRELVQPERRSAPRAVFRAEGHFWTLSYEGEDVRVKDAKGMRDLAMLLRSPMTEFAALDLVAEGPTVQGDAGELIDRTARDQYKARLRDLEDEIREAEEIGDGVRASRAADERDAIAHELSSAYGLGGRVRLAGHPAERARTTVTRRIKEAIVRIENVHPALGRHLRNSIRTGAFCSYAPEQKIDWEL